MNVLMVLTNIRRIVLSFSLFIFLTLASVNKSSAQEDACSSLLSEMDVTNYRIKLMIQPDSQTIAGFCEIQLNCGPIDTLHFDLLTLEVDSVYASFNNGSLVKTAFIQRDAQVLVPNITGKSAARVTTVIYYKGKPVKDGSWGGFYFSGDYAFNLGVGFEAEPHNYGRVWFPCKDNFCDRASYDFEITTPADLKAVCNGSFEGSDTSGNTITWRYHMKKDIPTYLASVAVGPYVQVLPQDDMGYELRLHAQPSDSLNMLQSFMHLPNALQIFEEHYGPHPFDIAGYSLVPFNAGAMEHATNIAYPRYAVAGGGLAYETLMAHELAHHWWGNHKTTESAPQMWLNEGWASYSEFLFLEKMYGRDAYDNAVAANHKNILHYAHLRDGAALPVSGVGHDNTYGMHVYKKGADVIHALRHVMGDSAFFTAIDSLMRTSASTINTDELKQHLGKFLPVKPGVDLVSDFFSDRINGTGFGHFSVFETSKETDRSGWILEIKIKQRVKLRDALYRNVQVPLRVLFADGSFSEREIVLVNGDLSTFRFVFTKEPLQVWIDPDREMSFATSDYTLHFKDSSWAIANPSEDQQFFVIENPTSATDEMLMRVNHHWVSPDHTFNKNKGIVLSRQRYFSLEGKWTEANKYTLRFTYNGTTPQGNFAAGWLDDDLIRGTEDSLLIMYRPKQTATWQIWEDTEWIRGSLFDKRGIVRIKNLVPGEYCLAIRKHDFFASLAETVSGVPALKAYPNPADKQLYLQFESADATRMLEITDELGRLFQKRQIDKNTSVLQLNTSDWAAGKYYIGLQKGTELYEPRLVIIRH